LVNKAIAHAFRNAAKSFDVGAYLEDRKFAIRYLKNNGDQRWASLIKSVG
jgi:hypothetical protein